ncbi:MAG: hypothetical protein M1827_004618 [Pycnora praestabilis]|nr:MAG: hypothetical protein M1827_004618 [Pycnora praestabilis]
MAANLNIDATDRRSLLRKDSSDLSNVTFDLSPSHMVSPSTSIHRIPFKRNVSEASATARGYEDRPLDEGDTVKAIAGDSAVDRGLGIAFDTNSPRRTSIPRVPVGFRSPHTPGSADPLLSPPSYRNDLNRDPKDPNGHDGGDPSYDTPGQRQLGQSSSASLHSSIHQPFVASPDTEALNNTPRSTFVSVGREGYGQASQCKSHRNIYQGRGSWLSVTILILAIYSTVFSGIYLVLAIGKPRYGRHIRSNGSFLPSTATLLSALFAKTIELSFVTVFVAFLGQALSRRSLVKQSNGLTIAEMAMRSWIMQPGSILTHWESVRYAALTFLGAVSLTAALLAILYTTAAEALVAPKLMFGAWEDKTLYGLVKTSFGDPPYVQTLCQTPIPTSADVLDSGTTCLSIEHAGQAYHSYTEWLARWTQISLQGNGSTDLKHRPNGMSMLYDNTTVGAAWIEVKNMTQVSQDAHRIVNNVTMAMPHSGIFQAARDERNGILQPADLEGLGEYSIIASVPSPAVNVLCASMSEEDLAPLVYTEWPNANSSLVSSTWADSVPAASPDQWLNSTVVDDLFGWGEKYNRRPPVFPKLPIAFNTITNITIFNLSSIYVLANGSSGAIDNRNYTLCSMKAELSPNCSTRYNASASGGSLWAHCEDTSDHLAYSRTHPEAPIGVTDPISRNWGNIASEWAMATSLNEGAIDGNASNARLLTQLIPTDTILDPMLPSIAEALAVLAGYTLIISAQDSPFVHYWPYAQDATELNPGQYENFSASLLSQQYASGGQLRWQGIFYTVLTLVFVTNLFCLGYLILRGGLVTDFTEPQNLFALSINSPPSQRLAGSCGGGPEKEHFQVNWFVHMDNEHFLIESGEEPPDWKKRRFSTKSTFEMENRASPIASTYSKLSSSRRSVL